MTQLTIVTTPTNSGDGTPLATAFNYCNSNFNELYARFQVDPPASLIGTTGDVPGMYAVDSTYFYYCFDAYDGVSTIWSQVTQVGNITVSSISSGTSNVAIVNISGNVVTRIGGTELLNVSPTGMFVNGGINAAANIRAEYFVGNGSRLTGLAATYSNANVVSLLSAFGSNVISTTGTVTAGNITGGNLLTNNRISATGNITTSGFFVGNFAGNITGTITNVPGPGGAVLYNDGTGNVAATAGLVFNNSGPNVLTVQGSYSATGGVIAAGNITGGNLSGTNITGTLTTAAQTNITSLGTLTSLSVSGNVQGGNLRTAGQISATGNIRTAAYLFAGQDVNVSGDVTATSYTGTSSSLSGNVTGGNIRTSGHVSATGNVTGNYFIGNGSQLTNLITNTIQNGNSNVLIGSSAGNVSINVNGISPVVTISPLGMALVGNLSATTSITGGNLFTGGEISATGDIRGGNIRTNGVSSATGNVTAGNVITGGQVSATGNITGGNIFSSGLISATGNITGGNVTVSTGTITVGNIVNGNGNTVGNIGTSTNYFNTVFAQATSAQYADLAENYKSDSMYAPGTVVVFGGDQEITISREAADERVAGVISTNPAHLMNAGQPGLPVALRGRVPVMVMGPVFKGDSLVTSDTSGHAQSVGRDRSYGQAVFAKAIETNTSPGEKIIQAVIL